MNKSNCKPWPSFPSYFEISCTKCNKPIIGEWCTVVQTRDSEGEYKDYTKHKKCPVPNPLLKTYDRPRP